MEANILVMGKTGAGKSTLINSVIGEDVAPTGIGESVTKRNETYLKSMRIKVPKYTTMVNNYSECLIHLKLHDTVGLELSEEITMNTLSEIRIKMISIQSNDSINLVWFCVDNMRSRFEEYEIRLIRALSISYEIPFIIVITKCYDDSEGELVRYIKDTLPEVGIVKVLAKAKKTKVGTIESHGIPELLKTSIFDYDFYKIPVLDFKLKQIPSKRNERLMDLQTEVIRIIEKHAKLAMKIGFVPGGCIPVVHGICVKMISKINDTLRIHTTKGFVENVLMVFVVGLVATPFMAVPLLSAPVAYAYVQGIGETYRDILFTIIEKSTDEELLDIKRTEARIKEELSKRSKKGGK